MTEPPAETAGRVSRSTPLPASERPRRARGTVRCCLHLAVDFPRGGGRMAKPRRTTHRSSAGKKLYAVRDASGRFKDIQTYERAHRADLRKTSTGEPAQRRRAAKARPAKKKKTR